MIAPPVRPAAVVAVLAILALLTTAPTGAHGQTVPVVRIMAGNGFDTAYRLGIGGSSGVEVPFIRGKRFFVGVRGLYHFGSEGVLDGFEREGLPSPTGSVTQFQSGIEIGATWMTAPLFIRSVGGVGMSRVNVDLETGESDLEGSSTKLQMGPGLLIALPSESGTFAGVEIRWLKVSDLASALSIYATIGRRIF